ncbi:hypothetical protein [Frigidibacter sp. ROC022]|uniref:hypothetical protein n=1 Tax=Frigidibacter sp. ROC022 TaxID=2971796 RepID=UPI00215A1742|nr:hypothetical protein [Frigidibacter sp. ROC022]MCR8725195.1 hypothetical protein [Frigidibacter sp. ROC022]
MSTLARSRLSPPRLAVPFLLLLLPACAILKPQAPAAPGPEETPAEAGLLVSAPPPPPTARTVEEFDTTTAAERAAAAKAPAPSGERSLGRTVASLGDPAAPGFWLETPLVKSVTQGRVVLPASGAVVQVELRPIDGPASAGSRLSLAAMRLLGVALTDLPEIEVYAG